MKWEDPIVKEVRETRRQHAARFGNDLAAIFADLRAQEAASGRRVVSRPTKRAEEPLTKAS